MVQREPALPSLLSRFPLFILGKNSRKRKLGYHPLKGTTIIALSSVWLVITIRDLYA
jgi:hypothetical protein